MSTVLKPSGPLPPRIYWVRRLLLLAVCLVVLVGGWWWLIGPGNSPSSAATQSAGRSPGNDNRNSSSHNGSSSSTEGGSGRQSAGSGSTSGGGQQPGGPGSHNPSGGSVRHARHSGPEKRPLRHLSQCHLATVHMTISISDSVTGHPNTATLLLTVPPSAPPCRLPITPDSLVARVTSGADVVWSSTDCPDALLARQVVVRPDPATAYELTWNGRRSTGGCAARGQVARPGSYWFEAAFIGGEPAKAHFTIKPASSKNSADSGQR